MDKYIISTAQTKPQFATWREFMDKLPDDICEIIMEFVIPSKKKVNSFGCFHWKILQLCNRDNSSPETAGYYCAFPLYMYPSPHKNLLHLNYRNNRKFKKKRFSVMFNLITLYNRWLEDLSDWLEMDSIYNQYKQDCIYMKEIDPYWDKEALVEFWLDCNRKHITAIDFLDADECL